MDIKSLANQALQFTSSEWENPQDWIKDACDYKNVCSFHHTFQDNLAGMLESVYTNNYDDPSSFEEDDRKEAREAFKEFFDVKFQDESTLLETQCMLLLEHDVNIVFLNKNTKFVFIKCLPFMVCEVVNGHTLRVFFQSKESGILPLFHFSQISSIFNKNLEHSFSIRTITNVDELSDITHERRSRMTLFANIIEYEKNAVDGDKLVHALRTQVQKLQIECKMPQYNISPNQKPKSRIGPRRAARSADQAAKSKSDSRRARAAEQEATSKIVSRSSTKLRKEAAILKTERGNLKKPTIKSRIIKAIVKPVKKVVNMFKRPGEIPQISQSYNTKYEALRQRERKLIDQIAKAQ